MKERFTQLLLNITITLLLVYFLERNAVWWKYVPYVSALILAYLLITLSIKWCRGI